MKKYIKEIISIISIFLMIPLILSIFNLFEIEIHPIIYLISMIIISFLSGLCINKHTKNKNYKLGILFGFLIIILLFILSLIFNTSLSINMITYYLIIIISTTLGSIIKLKR